MRIALCVSVPNGGENLLKRLAASAAQLASGAHEVALDFTCHSEAQRDANNASNLALKVNHTHIVAREERPYWQRNSVTHSRCVNALYKSVDADVAVICDYDMALTRKYWDQILVNEIIDRGVAFVGSPYAADAGFNFNFGSLSVFAMKYQGKPNCIFSAFSPNRLRPLSERICDFANSYGDPNSIPIRFISNQTESRRAGLPVGSFENVDTGSRIPQLIEDHALTFATFERRIKVYNVLKSAKFPDSYPPFLYPEEYFLGGAPFVVHFRKGASKPVEDTYGVAQFSRDVDAWIASTCDGPEQA